MNTDIDHIEPINNTPEITLGIVLLETKQAETYAMGTACRS